MASNKFESKNIFFITTTHYLDVFRSIFSFFYNLHTAFSICFCFFYLFIYVCQVQLIFFSFLIAFFITGFF